MIVWLHWLFSNSKMLFAILLKVLLSLFLRSSVVAQTCPHGSVLLVSYVKTFDYMYVYCFSSPHLLPMELLKSAWIILGVVFALTSGITKMPVWSVKNWDTLLTVNVKTIVLLHFCIHKLILGAVGSSVVYYSSHTIKHSIIDLNCTGNENTILDCPYNGLSNYYCSLSKDANIFCECECSFVSINDYSVIL